MHMKYIHLFQGGPQQWSANADVRIITARPTGGLGPGSSLIRSVSFSEYTQNKFENTLNKNWSVTAVWITFNEVLCKCDHVFVS